jgi:23S rRNA G2069 N7-methylase RlmK/C1962 C5-methylase RlmI
MAYYFEGDLCQMSNQRKFLLDNGFNIKMSNVYPTIESEEKFIEALKLIWQEKCDGWWHYNKEYIKYNICTIDEYKDYLNFQYKSNLNQKKKNTE